MFGYNSTVIYALTVVVNSSNMHDSIVFYPTFDKFVNKFNDNMPQYFSGDAAYITPRICKTIIDLDMIPCLPYKRPMTKDGYFKKYEYEYVYDEKNDCTNCSFEEQCTKMKAKQRARHLCVHESQKICITSLCLV